MRQVPAFTYYLIIGDGLMARHFRHYLELESIPYAQWSRSSKSGISAVELTDLAEKSKEASHVLVLVSDASIDTVCERFSDLWAAKCVIHFSGAHVSKSAFGAHPLMTFSSQLYGLDDYRKTPFVIEAGGPAFHELLPGLTNLSFQIDPSLKPHYHALCAMAGNFTVLLWEKAFAEFQSKLEMPKSVLLPYLDRIARNLADSAQGVSVLTGPLSRGDTAVVQRHLRALEGDAYGAVYRAFAEAFEASSSTKRAGQRASSNTIEISRSN